MIESCSDLPQCEAILGQALSQVRLIGELPYTPEDLKHLAGLIRARIASGLHEGTDSLAREAPTCLACFLVWTGIEGYKGNTYWPAVRAWTGTGLEDPNWQRRWGQIFLHLLHDRNLPTFDIAESTTYVTPILGHGGIPNTCLPEYFEKVLEPLVLRDLADPEDPDAIRYELRVRREDEAECAGIAAEKARLEERVRKLQKQVSEREARLTAFKDIRRLHELEAQVRDMAVPAGLPTDFAAFRHECESQLQSLETGQREAEDRRKECELLLAAFDESDRRVISSSDLVRQVKEQYAEHLIHWAAALTLEADQSILAERLHNQARAILTTDWQASFGAVLTAVPFAQLSQSIERCSELSVRRTELMVALKAANLDAEGEHLRSKPPRSAALRFLARMLAVFHRKSLRKADQIRSQAQADRHRALHTELDRLTEELVRQRESISNLLTGLPIAHDFLTTPNSKLYESLTSLNATYQKWLCGEERLRFLCQQRAEIEAEIEKLSVALGVPLAADSETTIASLETRLQAAVQRKLAAESAHGVLLSEIEPRLKALAAERASIERRLREVGRQLSQIGDGSPEVGSALVAQAQTLRQEAATLREELRWRYPDLSALERAAYANFKEAEAQLATEMHQLRIQVNEIAVEIKAYPDC